MHCTAFSDINDSFGHAAGDEALRRVAEAMTAVTRARDLAARVGADEFVLLLPDMVAEEALRVCRRIQLRLATRRAGTPSGGPAIPVSVAIGTVGFGANDVLDPTTVLVAAERAVEESKRSGNNRVVQTPADTHRETEDDALTLFHEVGHALHYFSSAVEYPTLNNGVRDYIEFQSQLLERWLSTDRVIDHFLVHHETGEPIPAAASSAGTAIT